jgi:predicted lysophospholipase L1 biosynthesis ABC-type transport system permease subunit
MNPARDLPIVGVAHDSRWNDLTGANEPFLYLPLGRYKPSYGTVEVIVRPRQGAGTQASQAVAAAAARLDPSVPVSFSRHLTAKIDGTVREQRTFAWMLSLLGGVALALAGLGLHGLVAQATAERRREFGIRLALGANGGDLVRLVLRHAAVVSVCGTLAGLTMVWLGTRLIEGMLFGVSSLDARVYVAAIVVLCGVVGIACLVPVLHALRLRPVEVLRAE